jgi:hypothetical protein
MYATAANTVGTSLTSLFSTYRIGSCGDVTPGMPGIQAEEMWWDAGEEDEKEADGAQNKNPKQETTAEDKTEDEAEKIQQKG